MERKAVSFLKGIAFSFLHVNHNSAHPKEKHRRRGGQEKQGAFLTEKWIKLDCCCQVQRYF